MLCAKLTEGILMKKLVEAIKDLFLEINFDISASGIAIQGMDNSHISLVQINITSNDFAEYRCDKNMKLGIKMENFAKIIKCGTNEDTLTLSYDDNDKNKLNIKFENILSKKTVNFELALISIETENISIPVLNYTSSILMSSSYFSKICKELNSIDETISIQIKKDKINFYTNNENISGGFSDNQNDSTDPEIHCKIETDCDINLPFSSRILNIVSKAGSISKQVYLYLGSKKPLLILYKFGQLGEIKFYLAERNEIE